MTTENLNKEDEVKDEEVKNEETIQETKPAPSATELAAREAGWVTKDEWVAQGKNPEDWRSAKEYQERGELFDEIHNLKESDKKTKAAFKALLEHHRKVYETATKEALAKLKAEKKEALENHDIDRVFAIDEEIESVRTKEVDVPKIDLPEPEVGPTVTFKKWHKENKWYSLNDEEDDVSRWADQVGLAYRRKNPNSSEEEFLAHVESKVAKRFPEVFENKNATRVSEVNPKQDNKPTNDTFKLNDEEEKVCKMLVESGTMTRKQYVEEIKKVRGAP